MTSVTRKMAHYRPIRTSAFVRPDLIDSIRVEPSPFENFVVEEFWQYTVRQGIRSVPVQIFPHGCIQVRFNISPTDVEGWIYGPSRSAHRKGLFFAGTTVFGVTLRMDKARAIVGAPLHTLENLRLDLDCVWPRTDELRDLLWAAKSFEARRSILGGFIGRLGCTQNSRSDAFRQALTRVLSPSDRLRVANLARWLGVSERTLRNQFDAELGMSPKQLAGIYRFQRGLHRLTQCNRSIAAVAQEIGYADEAHFSRSFRSLVGVSPAAFRESLKIAPDLEHPFWREIGMDKYRSKPRVLRYAE